jgi:hypothetical protein
LTSEEKEALREKNTELTVPACCTTLIWVVAVDQKNRRYRQVRNRSDLSECFIELILEEVKKFGPEKIRQMIVGRKRPCTQAYQGGVI